MLSTPSLWCDGDTLVYNEAVLRRPQPLEWFPALLRVHFTGKLEEKRTLSPGPAQSLARSVSIGPGVRVSRERPAMPGWPGSTLWCRGPSPSLDSWGAHVG